LLTLTNSNFFDQIQEWIYRAWVGIHKTKVNFGELQFWTVADDDFDQTFHVLQQLERALERQLEASDALEQFPGRKCAFKSFKVLFTLHFQLQLNLFQQRSTQQKAQKTTRLRVNKGAGNVLQVRELRSFNDICGFSTDAAACCILIFISIESREASSQYICVRSRTQPGAFLLEQPLNRRLRHLRCLRSTLGWRTHNYT